MIKPRIETNIKKVTPQQVQLQPHLSAAGNSNNSASNVNNNQPLKLLSSLTNMVNSSLIQSTSKVTLNNSSSNSHVKTPNLNISMPTTCLPQPTTTIQPLLFQLSKQQKGKAPTIKQSLTSAQLLELQKSYTQQLTAATVKNLNALQTPVSIQMGTTSLSINTKIPIHTVASSVATTTTKSAFAKMNTKIITANTALNNMTQMQINQLVQQGVLVSTTANTMPALAKLQSTAAPVKSLQEQMKGLTPQQRDQFVKQYSAAAAGKQLQALTNTANPTLLASILKGRQIVQSTVMSPKAVLNATSQVQQQQQQQQQPTKKSAKVFNTSSF